MGEFKSLEEARKFFINDRFATESGAVIEELSEEACICSMPVTDHIRNAGGGVMGGAIYTLADFAFAVLSNNHHRLTVGQQSSISFLNGAKGNMLYAKAVCRKDGRTSCVYNVDVYDDAGRDIAAVSFLGFKL
ncbi:MAG: PaaI family thioesterase [Solobacterium sp.]|nr:PaaI family thioesterase [Solobacterium sp.]